MWWKRPNFCLLLYTTLTLNKSILPHWYTVYSVLIYTTVYNTFSQWCPFSSLSLQLPGHTCCVLPEETNQLQPPHQSQQSLLYLRGDWGNQPDPPYWLRERPASLLAIGASQWGPGKHEQCSRGRCMCVWILSKIFTGNEWNFWIFYDIIMLPHQLKNILQTVSDKSSN